MIWRDMIECGAGCFVYVGGVWHLMRKQSSLLPSQLCHVQQQGLPAGAPDECVSGRGGREAFGGEGADAGGYAGVRGRGRFSLRGLRRRGCVG